MVSLFQEDKVPFPRVMEILQEHGVSDIPALRKLEDLELVARIRAAVEAEVSK
jgi:hypothetical protein